MLWHATAQIGVALVIAVARLIAYAINDDKRWRRFLFLVFLALAVAAGWWLLADGGVQAVLREFGEAGIPAR
jgi:hypothetical protein